LVIEFGFPNGSIAIDQFSMTDFQLSSRLGFPETNRIMFELRLVIRTFFCGAIESPLTPQPSWGTRLVLSNTRQQLFGCAPPFALWQAR